MMNGVMFGNKHSYLNWGLLLKTRPSISPPVAKTVYVDIPSSDGVLDLTESLTNDVKYNNRTIICEFVVNEGRSKWASIYSDIQDYLQGQKMQIVFDDDPDFYYTGRLSVNDWQSDKTTATIVIEGNVEPYKMEQFSSVDDWEWDSFDFESGVIREYGQLVVEDTLTLNVVGRRKKVIPVFNVVLTDGNTMNVSYKGTTYNLQNGSNRILNIVLSEGDNVLTFIGIGTVSVDYRGGRL
jgi:predicted phage tail component-like protein